MTYKLIQIDKFVNGKQLHLIINNSAFEPSDRAFVESLYVFENVVSPATLSNHGVKAQLSAARDWGDGA